MNEIGRALRIGVELAFIAYVINTVVTLATGGRW